MTDRERWTVYPLLFLALGVSLKDKMLRSVNTDEVRCKTMVCNELLVAGAQGTVDVRAAGGSVQAKSLVVADAASKQRVSIGNGSVQATNVVCNALVVPGANGKEAAAISANNHGGFVRTTGIETGTITFLGNTAQIAGLLFIDSHGAIHPGPIFASPVKKPAESEPAAEPETPANEEADAKEPAADDVKKSPESGSADKKEATPAEPN
jgi:hypothetical protein